MIDRKIIINLANKFSIDEYSILREYLQLIFLKNFYQISETTKVFFKGGTAIHFLLHSFRFSEDLDFSSSIPRNLVKKIIKRTIEKSETEAPGLKMELLADKHISTIFRLKFPTELSIRPLTIRIEVSYRERPLSRKVSVVETEFPVLPFPIVVHYDFEEILAEKIRAILLRKKGRDILDVWFLLSRGIKFNRKFVEEKLSYYGKKFSFALLKEAVDTIPSALLKNDLEKFLPKGQRKIIPELKSMLLSKIAGLASGNI